MDDLGQSLPFIHPAIMWGALATGLVPVLIHLWNRRRYRRVPWAAMRFLRAASRRSARRLWLERIVLLLLRIAVIACFGLAVARPYLTPSAWFAARGTRVHRIIMLDNSLSMNALTHDASTRFDRAKGAALRLLDTFPERDGVSLVTMASPGRAVIDDPMYVRRLVRDRLGAIEATQRRDDPAAAFDTLLGILRVSEFPAANRAVYLISDVPRTTWTRDDRAAPTAAVLAFREVAKLVGDVKENITVARIAGLRDDNLAITRLAVDTPIVGLNLPVSVELEVANLGTEPARDLEARILRDGMIVRTETLPHVAPGGVSVARVTVAFSNAGTHAVEARLVQAGDALAIDDARYLSIEARSTTPVLLVDGRSGSGTFSGETGFLATALAPSSARTAHRGLAATAEVRVSPLEPKVISETELADEPLDEYRTITLCNVSRLSTEQWTRVARFVADGGGLLVTGGDLISTENYNRFGYADGTGVLPVRFSGAPVSGDLGFASDSLTHPITAVFAGHGTSGLFAARVSRFLPVEPHVQRSAVALRFTNGAPALVAGTYGSGRVVVLTTTVNLDWTNLPAKGDFVSLMYNAVTFVTRREGARRNLAVGQSLTEPLAAAQSGLPIRAVLPDGTEWGSELVVADSRFAARVAPLERAGLYALHIGADRLDVAVNTDPVESDLRSMDEPAFSNAVGVPFRWVADADSLAAERVSDRAMELSFPLFCLVVLLLFVEVLLAWWFGSSGDPRAGRSSTARGRAE